MISQIQSLHTAYCEAAALELALNCHSERLWFDALKWGVTPDDVRLVVKHRIKQNQIGRVTYSLKLSVLIGGEDRLAEFSNELALIRAEMRKHKHPPGKAEVLQATGRPTEIEQPARIAADVMRAAFNKALQ